MNLKAKGTNAERELIHLLWERGWFAVRVAGSGSSRYPSPDIVAGNGLRRLAIECKSSSDDRRYITRSQIDELVLFAQKLGAEPWVAFRHNAEWFFVGIDELKATSKSMMVSEELARNWGLSIDQLAGDRKASGLSSLS
ncbi:Holliday junction resolvase [Candidatus Woesearchaeota archaeon]|nr:Holliday junction resolvase [Candidatus Woesearchaeota archaeon]